jgi:hypothetical protein
MQALTVDDTQVCWANACRVLKTEILPSMLPKLDNVSVLRMERRETPLANSRLNWSKRFGVICAITIEARAARKSRHFLQKSFQAFRLPA